MACERERIKIRRSTRRNFPTQRECRHRRQRIQKSILALGDFDRLADVNRRRIRLAWNCRKILLYQVPRFRLIEIAGNHQHGIIRRVVNPKKFADILDRGSIEVLHRANRRMRVGRILETHLEESQETIHVRLIVIAQTLFFLDRFALIIEILLRHIQRTHAIAFQPESQR